ncbi:hypothetical protein HPP92_011954 [Vanilla planifolia]|uniref:Uncharacterized protein n=1 Tax=Vanilla planifolia TaxID=51239 RepID=A0A835R9G8_VANPL|nr:hypothetical protein HPP92_011945 [Vanilla planifolia]KAG0483870.1 hypothetical protein HPP92_011954 [Vanilla planifolia]
MATSIATCICLIALCSLLLLPVGTDAARAAPGAANADLKQKDCVEDEAGAASFPSFNGYPSFSDFDHSGPAAANGQYIPGFDDTFVPNPGYEVPRSSAGISIP